MKQYLLLFYFCIVEDDDIHHQDIGEEQCYNQVQILRFSISFINFN